MKKLVFLSIFMSFFAVTTSRAATEVFAWAQWAYGSTCLTNLQTSHGGVNLKDGLTAIGLQFWKVNSNGTLSSSGESASGFVTWAHQNGVKVLLTVYNGGASWDWASATSAIGNAETFATNLVNTMNQNGLDGIDLDLEGNALTDPNDHRTQYNAFVANLSAKLKSAGKMLTICTFDDCGDPAGDNNCPNTDWWVDWVGKADYIHTMLYGEGGSLACQGINGTDDQYFYSTQQSIGTTGGYAASQISMGLPSYDDGNWQTYATTHLDECYALGASICIWDLEFRNSNWNTSSTLWNNIKRFKSLASNYSLTITKVGGGTVTTNPTGSSFAPNTSVTLTAAASSGYTFTGWSGAVTGTTNPTTITMNGNKAVTATFTSNNPSASFDLLANGLWESFKDSFGSTVTMTKSSTSVATTWTMVKNPANDWSYIGIDSYAADGSFAGLTSIVLTYTSSKPLIISLTDPLLTSNGDDYMKSLPAATTASTVTLTTADFAQPSDPTTKSPLRLDSVISIAFSPDYDATSAAGSGNFTITQLKVNGTTLSATKAKNRLSSVALKSSMPVVRSIPAGLEIENLQSTRLVTVYNAVGQALASVRPNSSQAGATKVALGKNNGVIFVRSIGLDGSSAVQKIIR
jgi:uncharacterized repeat protein (TIGR02543 family)